MPRINDGRRRTSDVEDSDDEKENGASADGTAAKDFKSLMLRDEIVRGLEAAGYLKPSPVQSRAIPLGTFGADLIVQAKSGTGKTCMFAVIILESIMLDYRSPQALVVSPTRELAHQTRDVIIAIGQFLPELGCEAFVGGIATDADVAVLSSSTRACHVATGTPGRLRALMEMGVLHTEGLRQLVLDEVDVLLCGEFKPQVEQLMAALPSRRQTLAVSATFSPELLALLHDSLRQPHEVSLVKHTPALKGVRQFYIPVPSPETKGPLAAARRLEARSEALLKLLDGCAFHQAIVFSASKAHGQRIAQVLDGMGYPARFVCGQQPQSERLAAVASLRAFELRVLVSSDLTSRGIDVDRVNLVVNLELPPSHETYLHRVGRTGRYGTLGVAVTLVDEGQESQIRDMATALDVDIPCAPEEIPRARGVCASITFILNATLARPRADSTAERRPAGAGPELTGSEQELYEFDAAAEEEEERRLGELKEQREEVAVAHPQAAALLHTLLGLPEPRAAGPAARGKAAGAEGSGGRSRGAKERGAAGDVGGGGGGGGGQGAGGARGRGGGGHEAWGGGGYGAGEPRGESWEGGGTVGTGRDLGCLKRGVGVLVAGEWGWQEGWVLGRGSRPGQFWVQVAGADGGAARDLVDVSQLWRRGEAAEQWRAGDQGEERGRGGWGEQGRWPAGNPEAAWAGAYWQAGGWNGAEWGASASAASAWAR